VHFPADSARQKKFVLQSIFLHTLVRDALKRSKPIRCAQTATIQTGFQHWDKFFAFEFQIWAVKFQVQGEKNIKNLTLFNFLFQLLAFKPEVQRKRAACPPLFTVFFCSCEPPEKEVNKNPKKGRGKASGEDNDDDWSSKNEKT
jgi:hypothetical protein